MKKTRLFNHYYFKHMGFWGFGVLGFWVFFKVASPIGYYQMQDGSNRRSRRFERSWCFWVEYAVLERQFKVP